MGTWHTSGCRAAVAAVMVMMLKSSSTLMSLRKISFVALITVTFLFAVLSTSRCPSLCTSSSSSSSHENPCESTRMVFAASVPANTIEIDTNQSCPDACSGHGRCILGECRCYRGYHGRACAEDDVHDSNATAHQTAYLESLSPFEEPGRTLRVCIFSQQWSDGPLDGEDYDTAMPGATLAAALGAEGHEVVLAFLAIEPLPVSDETKARWTEELRRKRVILSFVEKTRHKNMSKRMIFGMEAMNFVRNYYLVVGKVFDVIHFHDGIGTGSYLGIAKAQETYLGLLTETVLVTSIELPHFMRINALSADAGGGTRSVDDLEAGLLERQGAQFSDVVLLGGPHVEAWVEERGWQLSSRVAYGPRSLPIASPSMAGLAGQHPIVSMSTSPSSSTAAEAVTTTVEKEYSSPIRTSCVALSGGKGTWRNAATEKLKKPKSWKVLLLIESYENVGLGFNAFGGYNAGTENTEYELGRGSKPIHWDVATAASVAEDVYDALIAHEASQQRHDGKKPKLRAKKVEFVFYFVGTSMVPEDVMTSLRTRAKTWAFSHTIRAGSTSTFENFVEDALTARDKRGKKKAESLVALFLGCRLRNASSLALVRRLASLLDPHSIRSSATATSTATKRVSPSFLVTASTPEVQHILSDHVRASMGVSSCAPEAISRALFDVLNMGEVAPPTCRALDERTVVSSNVALYRRLSKSGAGKVADIVRASEFAQSPPSAASRAARVADVASSRDVRFEAWAKSSWQPKLFLSVIITHYNRTEFLGFALQSLVDQDYPQELFEVIVVDDGSPDPKVHASLDTIEASFDFKRRGWRIERGENRYLGGARNHGASLASGKYILFMDDDNYAKPHELSTMARAVEYTGADLATSFCDFFYGHDAPMNMTEVIERQGQWKEDYNWSPQFVFLGGAHELGLFKNSYGDANTVVRKSAFEAMGGYTEDRKVGYEDWELFSRAAIEGHTMILVPESMYWYRFTDGSMQKTTLFSTSRRRSLRPFVHVHETLAEEEKAKSRQASRNAVTRSAGAATASDINANDAEKCSSLETQQAAHSTPTSVNDQGQVNTNYAEERSGDDVSSHIVDKNNNQNTKNDKDVDDVETGSDIRTHAREEDQTHQQRICILSSEVKGPTSSGSMGEAMSNLAFSLADHGHVVTLVSTVGRGVANDDTAWEHWVKTFKERGVSLESIYVEWPRHYRYTSTDLWQSYEAYAWLRRNRVRCDSVHFGDFRGAGFVTAQMKRLGIMFDDLLVVTHVHGPSTWATESRQERWPHDLQGMMRNFVERAAIEKADVVVTPSTTMLEWLREANFRLPERQHVLPDMLPRWSAAMATTRLSRRPSEASTASEDARLPFISVVMVSYNQDVYLREAIESLAQQDYPANKLEVVLVDSGSSNARTNSTIAAMASLFTERQWQVLYTDSSQRFPGIAAANMARNLGASAARGDFLVFMDDDNVALPFEMRYFGTGVVHSGADIITTSLDFCFEAECKDVLHDITTSNDTTTRAPPHGRMLFAGGVAGGPCANRMGDTNMIVKKTAFDAIGGFTDSKAIKSYADWELLLRASLYGLQVEAVPVPLFLKRDRSDNISRRDMNDTRDFDDKSVLSRMLGKRLPQPFVDVMMAGCHHMRLDD